MKGCAHFDQVRKVTPRASECEERLKAGGTWVTRGYAQPVTTLAAAILRRISMLPSAFSTPSTRL